MVSVQFHFNGFLPNMLYAFYFCFNFLFRLYLVITTFIIWPKKLSGVFKSYPSKVSVTSITVKPTSRAYVAPRSLPWAWVSGIISSLIT